MQTNKILKTTSIAITAVFILLTMAPVATAAADADADLGPRYSTRATDIQKISKLAAYCSGSSWQEIWSVRQTTEIGYYDNDNDWNREASIYSHNSVRTYYGGSCKGNADLKDLITTTTPSTESNDAAFEAATPRYSTRNGGYYDVAKVAGYCDTSGNWHEVWRTSHWTAVGYYDNDNDWNEDYRLYGVPGISNRINGGCTNSDVLNLAA